MKKLFALILTVAMLASLVVTVSAEETETGNLSITCGDETYYYDCIEEAFEDAQDGDVIKVEKDYWENSGTIVCMEEEVKSVTLDLNGKEIHFPEGYATFEDHGFLDIYHNVTFIDTVGGGIIHALVAVNENAVVKSGTYRGFWAYGNVTIEGGTFLGLPQDIVDNVNVWDDTEKELIGTKGLLLTTWDRVFLSEDEAREALDAIIADGYTADKPYDINTYEKGGETRYSAGFAAGTTVSKNNDYNTTITYTVAPTFTVTIPATVALGEDATISAENVVVPKGKQVEVSIAEANGFKATTPEGAEITYTVKNGEDAVAEGDTVLAVNPKDGKTGSTTLSFVAPETIQYAGTYTGTVTFTVAVKDVPVTTISFTIYNPAGGAITEYSAEKGMTWGDWLESTYNNAGFAIRSDGRITYITIGSSYAGVALELSYLVEDFVKSTDVIQEDYTYVWMQIGG